MTEKVWAQLEIANRLGVQFTLILGQKELLDGTIIIRNMEGGEQEVIDRLDSQYKKLGNTLCTLCHKCLPCPEGINIPEVLRLRNLSKAFDMVEFGKYRYKMFGNADHWFGGMKAVSCTRCNDCLPRCPENLRIPDLLFETHEMLYFEEGNRGYKYGLVDMKPKIFKDFIFF